MITSSSETLRARLFDGVSYGHAEGSEIGDRYRMANLIAAKISRRLEREFIAPGRFVDLRHELRRFFHMGQEEKLRVGRAA